MRAWRDFFPEVLPFIADGIPDPMLERRVLRSAQRFCERTRAWRVTLEPISLLAGVTNYEMELPQQTELVRLEEGALLDGMPIDLWRPGDRARGRYVSTVDRKTVELSCAPAAGQTLVLVATLKPGLGAAGIEDFLFDQYSEVIADGSVARINDDGQKLQAFEDRCSTIATELWRGSAATRPRARPHFF